MREIPAAVGDGSLRSAMPILHVRGDDVSAKQGTAHVRRARPGRPVLHRLGGGKDPGYRWRAAGAEGNYAAVPQPFPVSGRRNAAGAYADDQRHPAVALCGGTRRAGRGGGHGSLGPPDPDKFTMITRGGLLPRVLEGIAAAQTAGLAVKLNAVALKGFTEDGIDDLIDFAHAGGMTLTLIETMPLGEIGADRTDQFLPLSSLRRQIEQRWTLVDLAERTGGPARSVRVIETGGNVGFITPMTHNFCEDCNRVRVTASGVLHPCLGQANAVDLKRVLRGDGGDTAVMKAMELAVRGKPRGPDFEIGPGGRPALARHMSATGGSIRQRALSGGGRRET